MSTILCPCRYFKKSLNTHIIFVKSDFLIRYINPIFNSFVAIRFTLRHTITMVAILRVPIDTETNLTILDLPKSAKLSSGSKGVVRIKYNLAFV